MKNNGLCKLYSIIKSACVIFTIIVFLFYIMGNAISSQIQVLTLTNLFLLLLFSVWFSFSNLLLKSKKMNIFLRLTLHFISTVIGFFVIFVYLPGNLENKSQAFILVLGFAIIYIVTATAILALKGIFNKKQNNEQEYESVYDKSKQQD